MVTALFSLRERVGLLEESGCARRMARSPCAASQYFETRVTKVTFVHPDGTRETHAGIDGETVMDCALDHGVAGIRAQCGGACICVTCHCYVESPWSERIVPPRADELEMLEYAWEREPNSRLACQVVLDPTCAGIVIRLPLRQA
jgi:ferredoxin, 2Fe-2S